MKNNLTEIVLDAEIPTFDLKEEDWYYDNYQAVKGDFSQIYIKQYGVFKYKEYFKEDFFKTLGIKLTELFGEGDFWTIMFNKLKGHAGIPPHSDVSLQTFAPPTPRIHVPIITNEDVFFVLEDIEHHMELGKIYYFDNYKTHHVSNHSDEDRVHLVIDWKPNSSKVIKTFPEFHEFSNR